MADRAKKLEKVKQEIRSLLLTQPKGLPVKSLVHDYRDVIGQYLPFKDFGYNTPEEFLRSVPDVAFMQWSAAYGSYIVKAVADESTKHIEKLVAKQKTTNAPRRMGSSSMAPRFGRGYNTSYNAGYNTGYNTSYNTRPLKPFLPPSVKQEVYEVMKEYKNGLSLSNVLYAFRKKYGKELIYKNYGFLTLEDCLNSINEILLRSAEGDEMRVYPIIEKKVERSIPVWPDFHSTAQNTSSKTALDNKENQTTNISISAPAATPVQTITTSGFGRKPAEKKNMDILDNFSGNDQFSDNFGVNSSLREQFKQIMVRNPEGIWVTKFPEAYKKFTGKNLDHQKLGYFNQVDLFSDLPEIFRIEVIDHCKDDWMLFDATNPVKSTSHATEDDNFPSKKKAILEVIENIKIILKSNSCGIYIQDFAKLYEMNFGEIFYWKELGYDSVHSFLDSIAEKVPLEIVCIGRDPKVFFKKELTELPPALPKNLSQLYSQRSDFPADAVEGCTELEIEKLRKMDDFFPVMVSNIQSPSLMHIQVADTNISALTALMEELDLFYFSQEGEHYKMPRESVIIGVICAAPWPIDGHWHRIRIASIPSIDCILAYYIDYGTKGKIPRNELRFLRKQFMELPAQAIRCHLSNIHPISGTWDPRAREIIHSVTLGHPVMATITDVESISEGSLALDLCDTSNEEDIHINDKLTEENLAVYYLDDQSVPNASSPNILSSNSPPYTGMMAPTNKIQNVPISQPQLQAHPPGLSHGNMLQMSQANARTMRDPGVQNSNAVQLLNMLTNQTPNELTQSLLQQLQALGLNTIAGSLSAQPTQNSHLQKMGYANNMSSNQHPSSLAAFYQASSAKQPTYSEESDSEVFKSDEEIDADDNPEVHSISKRYVKRIDLDDGYSRVHTINIEDRPYMSSGDITYLLWNRDDPNFVRRKLKSKEISIPNITLTELGNEQLFYQLGKFQVKGTKSEFAGNNSITLFPLKNVIDILNIFGHPSVAVRDIIDSELLHFDPADSFWKTITEEEFVKENEEGSETDNDKEQKVCLYELKASLQALKFRKQTLKNQLYSSASIPSLREDIERTECQCAEVEKRIQDLQIKVVSHQRERRFD